MVGLHTIHSYIRCLASKSLAPVCRHIHFGLCGCFTETRPCKGFTVTSMGLILVELILYVISYVLCLMYYVLCIMYYILCIKHGHSKVSSSSLGNTVLVHVHDHLLYLTETARRYQLAHATHLAPYKYLYIH